MEYILQLDTELLLLINGFNHEYVDPFMRAFTRKTIWVIMYVVIAGVFVRKYGLRSALVLIAAAGLAVGAADLVCDSIIRPLVQRMRPTNPDNEISILVHIVDGYRSGPYGFPSCHAANTMALAICTGILMRSKPYFVFILIWSLMQCYSRIYLGVHYPGDIAVGALVGGCLGYIAARVAMRYADMDCCRPGRSEWYAVGTGIALTLYLVLRTVIHNLG